MQLLFVVLTACVSIGLSNGVVVDKMYGDSHGFDIPSRAQYLRFTSSHDHTLGKVLLWTRGKPEQTLRGHVYGNTVFMIDRLTQEDVGLYRFETKSDWSVTRYTLNVVRYEDTYEHVVGDNLELDSSQVQEECSVYFTDSSYERQNIVRKGIVLDHDFGSRLNFDPYSCNVEIKQLRVEDSGIYEIQDVKGNLALKVTVKVGEAMSTWMKVVVAAGILAAVVSCCCCVKRCCCKKSGSKSTGPDTGPDPVPRAGPATPLQQYSAEPGPPRYFVEPRPAASAGYAHVYQPGNPATPSAEVYAPTPVLPYPVPAAPQAPAPGVGGAAPPDAGLGGNFLCSNADPHFEKKGLSLAPPLSLGNTSADVYTSDKLNMNFL